MERSKKENLIALLLVAAGAAVYISLIFNDNVWLDEAFTGSLIRTDMAGVLERSMNDTLPPLYNIILKVMTDVFGYRVPVMKLTSVIPMILSMLLSATVFRKRHGFMASCILTTALFTMPNLLFFGVEIRMYSLGFFFAFASAVYAYECIAGQGRISWVLFTLFSVLSGYSHHFAFVTVGFVYLFLLLYFIFFDRKNIKRWFLSLMACFILYLPCLMITLEQLKRVSGYFSMPEITLAVFIKYIRYPYTVGFTPASILLLASVAALFIFKLSELIRVDKGGNVRTLYAISCILSYYGVLVFGTVISRIMTANILVDRYLFFAEGLIWIFFAIGVSDLFLRAGDRGRYVVLSVSALMALCGIAGYIREYRIEYIKGVDELTAFMEENIEDGDVLIPIEDNEEMEYCLPFYDEGLIPCGNIEGTVSEYIKENPDASVWCSVIDGKQIDDKELEEILGTDEISLRDEGSFSFDRYSLRLYELEPVY